MIAEKITFASTPLVCCRITAWRKALLEMEWFLSGSSNITDLHPSVRKWWEPWANEAGCVSNNYSKQLRHFGNEFDQWLWFVKAIQKHPFSRRNVLTTWNPEEMANPKTPITNCHLTLLQAFVDATDALCFVTYQRSADAVCGLPHNWIQAWALLLWTAHRTGHNVGSLTWIGGDVHLYEEHVPLVKKILSVEESVESPQLIYTPNSEVFLASDFSLSADYLPVIRDAAKMIV